MILHHDDALIVADKPAGLPTVPGRPPELHDCLWHRVRERWPDALVVHRLDTATSGLVLFARGAEVQRRLSIAFAQRRVSKGYEALAGGDVQGDSGEIDLPLAADWPNRPRQRVDAEHEGNACRVQGAQASDAVRDGGRGRIVVPGGVLAPKCQADLDNERRLLCARILGSARVVR